MFLLRDLGRLEDLGKLIEKAEKVSQVSKRTLFDEKGSYYELLGDYPKAIENYKLAIKMSLNNDNEDLKDHIKRCQTKINIFSRNRILKALRVLLGFDDI
jgi:tetratricopeptide (TPR) repeat protein